MLLMIFTPTLQPPTNVMSIIMLGHNSTVVEIIVLIIAKNPVTKYALGKTRLSFKRKGIVNHVMIAVVKGIIVVAKVIKVMGTMNGTNLEWQILPAFVMLEVTVLVELGWVFAAYVIPGVALPIQRDLWLIFYQIHWLLLSIDYWITPQATKDCYMILCSFFVLLVYTRFLI